MDTYSSPLNGLDFVCPACIPYKPTTSKACRRARYDAGGDMGSTPERVTLGDAMGCAGIIEAFKTSSQQNLGKCHGSS